MQEAGDERKAGGQEQKERRELLQGFKEALYGKFAA
jgi:hypothetical protein